jgi:hypothetical protein
VAGPASPVATSIASEPLAKGIQDNSFFIEEAFEAVCASADNGKFQPICQVTLLCRGCRRPLLKEKRP